MRKLATIGFCASILLSGAAFPAFAGASHGGGHASGPSTATGHGLPNGYVYDRTAQHPGPRCQPGVCFNP
jgi:hypothetical protein